MHGPIVVAAPGEYPAIAAGHIAERIAASLHERGSCSLMLCGGSTPLPVYVHLARMPVAWKQVTIYFGDERAVGVDDPESNFGAAQRALIERIDIPPAQVRPMDAAAADCDRAAQLYAAQLPERIDVLLLGVGPDGHTASLFPGSALVHESRELVACAAAPPPPLQPQLARMTITPVVIAAARQVVVMATGSAKADLIRRILDGPDIPAQLPAQLARAGTWILDPAAAAQLQPRNS